MKRLAIVCLLLVLLCGCREEGIIIETMTPSPPTSVTETKEVTTEATQPVQTQPMETTTTTTVPVGTGAYVLNTGSKKFHLPDCSSVEKIKTENRKESNATRYELMAEGYAPCGRCDP